jgi:flagellar hook-length control protein FliK
MNVERGQHNAVHGGHANHAAGKGGKGAAQAAGDQPATGFMALLSALDDAMDCAGDALGVVGEEADTGRATSDAHDDAGAHGQAGPDANAASVALAAAMGDATGLTNGQPPGASRGTAASGTELAVEADAATARRAQGARAEDKAIDSARATAAAMPDTTTAARPATDAVRGDLATVFEQLQNRLAAKGERDDATQTRELSQARAAAAAKTSAVTAATESRVDRMASLAAALPSFKQTVGADDAAAQAVKGIDSRKGDAASASRNDATTPWMQREFTPTVQFDGTVVGTEAAQPAPEAQVADQVSYWISQGIRNAELTVGGDGSDPVQVSISLSGNEAQVEFRAEHAGVREMLANSVDHLREALRSDGMLLAGVSVGSSGGDTSGQRDARSGQQRGDAAMRTQQATGRVEGAAASVPTPRAPAGTVDLFV